MAAQRETVHGRARGSISCGDTLAVPHYAQGEP